MKRYLFLLFMLIGLIKMEAQQFDLITVHAGFGQNNLSPFESLACAASYDGEGSYNIGLGFKHHFKKNFSILTGLDYSHNKLSLVPSFYVPLRKHFVVDVLSVPVNLEYKFLKYFIVGGGVFANFEIGKNEVVSGDIQNGIGANLYTGVSLRFSNYVFDIVPYYSINTLLPFKREKHYYRLWDAGIKFKIGYILN